MERAVWPKAATRPGMLGAVISGALATAAPAVEWEVIQDLGTDPSLALGPRD